MHTYLTTAGLTAAGPATSRFTSPPDAAPAPDRSSQSGWPGDDPRAFEHLFARYREGLERFLFRSLGNHEDAEDATVQAFFKAWRARSSFRGQSSEKTWLYRIGARVALDMIRSRRGAGDCSLDVLPRETRENTEDAEAQDPEEILLYADEVERTRHTVRQVLDQFPESHRRIFQLFYFEGHDYDAISRTLGLTRAQVRSRLHRVRGWLRRDLGEQFASS